MLTLAKKASIEIKLPNSEMDYVDVRSLNSQPISSSIFSNFYSSPTQVQQHKRQRPRTASSITSNASSRYVNTVTLSLNIPSSNAAPDILQRYWNYNNIKKAEVLRNRYMTEENLVKNVTMPALVPEITLLDAITAKTYQEKLKPRPSSSNPYLTNNEKNKNSTATKTTETLTRIPASATTIITTSTITETNKIIANSTEPLKQKPHLPPPPPPPTTTTTVDQIHLYHTVAQPAQVNCDLKTKPKKKKTHLKRDCYSAIGFTPSELNSRTNLNADFMKDHIKKLNSVGEFNKFKNKFNNQIHFVSMEPVSYNTRSIQPLNENRQYYEGLEAKRLNHSKFLQNRQFYLSQSLHIKKL